MRSIPEDANIFLGGDFKGSIGKEANTYDLVHGDFWPGLEKPKWRATISVYPRVRDRILSLERKLNT